MNQCVPSWDIQENPSLPLPLPLVSIKPQSITNSLLHHIPTLDYEVTELTWKDGHLGMHGFGVPKILPTKTMKNIYSPPPAAKCSPLSAGTLESLVNQATTISSSNHRLNAGDELVSWFDDRQLLSSNESKKKLEEVQGTFMVVAPTLKEDGKKVRVARLAHDWSSRVEQSISGSGTRGMESRQASHDTCETEYCKTGFTISTSLGSPGSTSSAKDCTTKTVDDQGSVCHSRNQRGGGKEEDKQKETAKLQVLGKRSRCAAVHNQSERKRRDKINQRMSILQKLVPNSSKTDKASMLDEVIEYMKQLQDKIEIMNRMNMSSMMLPLPLQQQLQMSMIPPMGMGMNMGMGLGVMDINTMIRPGMPPQVLYPNPFMSMASWDMQQSTSSKPADPLNATFLPFQSQLPMTMDAYSRMAALYQQFQAPATTPATERKVK